MNKKRILLLLTAIIFLLGGFLSGYLIKKQIPIKLEDYIVNYYCNPAREFFNCGNDKNAQTDLQVKTVDLKNDGKEEYIVLATKLLGQDIDGEKEGYPIFIIEITEDKYRILGEALGKKRGSIMIDL